MLYDPKWGTDQKADPFLFSNLIAWLERQPTSDEYPYSCARYCLHGLYFRDHGYSRIHVRKSQIDLDGTTYDLSKAFITIAVKYPRTFGAALERARKEEPKP